MLTVNQIYKDLIALIGTALKSQNLNWQVIQSYQQSMGNLQPPFVMLHRLLSTNYGYQYGKDKTLPNGSHIHTENQIETIKFQISVYKPRAKSETERTITAADVARVISSWFMSDTGIQAVKSKGYNIFRVTQVVEEYYKETDNKYQVNPYFVLEVVALQTYETPTNVISGFTGQIKEVEQLKNEEE